jgi:transketolase
MTAHGAYTLIDSPTGSVDVILIATGSEVQLAIAARDELAHKGIGARVVSAPCLEWFEEQSAEYRESVLPAAVTARVSVEAGLSLGWSSLVGQRGHSVSIEHFGASADYQTLFTEFGVTTEAVTAAAVSVLAR